MESISNNAQWHCARSMYTALPTMYKELVTRSLHATISSYSTLTLCNYVHYHIPSLSTLLLEASYAHNRAVACTLLVQLAALSSIDTN
jgi:hypothetical protein